MMSCTVHASTWDKDIIEFTTSLALDNNSNIYNRAVDPIDSSVYQLAIGSNNITLFDGYGVSLPFSINRTIYSIDDNLDNTAYLLNPAMQIFWSPETTLMLTSGVSKSQLFSGNVGAEFVNDTPQPIDKKQRHIDASINIGQAPQQEFLRVSLNYNDSEMTSKNLDSSNDSKAINAQYGYRISEDSYLQFSGNYAWQQASHQTTRLAETGIGFITGVGGSHELNVIVGAYQRIDQQQRGVFWTVSDRWQVSERATVNFSTSQRSILSNSTDNISQLTTTYRLTSNYQLSESHQLSLSINQQRSEIKNTNHANKNQGGSVVWRWGVKTGFELSAYADYTKTTRSNELLTSNHSGLNFGLRMGYQW